MEVQYLIKNGTIIDGTGAMGFRGDLRVFRGRITHLAPSLAAEGHERVVDATDCYVTPGFIETHNHLDASVWWSPLLEPASGYGITTSVNGNCGFSPAPMHQDPRVRKDMIDIFNYFEDIPEQAQAKFLPWDWRTWSEYKASMEHKVKVPVNYAAYCGHIPLRLTVMGLDAWNRAATPAEVEAMCDLLEDALAAGAMGLSSNTTDHDRTERPVPSILAEDAEWAALLAVLARHPTANLQIIHDTFMRMTAPQQAARIGQIAGEAGVRMQWVGVPTLTFQAPIRGKLQALHEQYKAEGRPFWSTWHHQAPTSMMNFITSLVFAQNGNPVWQEVVNLKSEDAKLNMLADPNWRDRARRAWESQAPHSYLNHPSALTLRESETGYTPTGITLADYMVSTGIKHASDAMAEWLLTNGIRSRILKKSWDTDEELAVQLIRDPRTVGNVSDFGAHGQLFCGAGHNVELLTHYVRNRQLLTIEEAVHSMTGKLADFFNLQDRGVLKEGAYADIAVFNLAEIEARPEEKVWDVPDGEGGRTYRYTRAPAPMRLTLVNGVATFDNGVVTGSFPGRFVGPSAPASRQAVAAE